MKRTTLALVNLHPDVRPAVMQAVRTEFPDADVMEVRGVGELLGAVTPDLVVLSEPDEATTASAALAMEPGGAPRWAVVILGGASSDLAETLPPEEWHPRSLGRVFRSAILQHALLCENLRMRGDLKTVARRISHDLRTPAGCIHTSSDLLDELGIGKNPSGANLSEVFRQSSTEISQIMERVSLVIRASSDPVETGPVDMGAVVASVLRQLEPEIRAAGEAITQPDTWPEVQGVESWLNAIWINLVRNSLQHGGTAVKIRLGWRREPDGMRFTIEDSGPGVSSARLAALFSPFDQLHTLRSTGLGLSIVERLVHLQGGRCGHEKPAEGGARFWFTLP